MQSNEMLQSDLTIEVTKHFSCPRSARQVMAGGKYMCRVKTDTEPLWLAYGGNDMRQVFKGMAKRRTLAGRCFERDARFHPRNSGKNLIDRLHHFLQARFFPCP